MFTVQHIVHFKDQTEAFSVFSNKQIVVVLLYVSTFGYLFWFKALSQITSSFTQSRLSL